MNFRKYYLNGNGWFNWKWSWNNLMLFLTRKTTNEKDRNRR